MTPKKTSVVSSRESLSPWVSSQRIRVRMPMHFRALISRSLKQRVSCSTAAFCRPAKGEYASSSSFLSPFAMVIAASRMPCSHWPAWLVSSLAAGVPDPPGALAI